MLLLLLLLKSVELDDDVALLLSVACLVMYSSAEGANQTQEKINVGRSVRIPRPTYFAANIRTRWHGKTPRQLVKVAAAGVCRSF